MNLSAYDKVNNQTGKDYIQVNYKRLLSSTIEYHDRYCILKRYDARNKSNSYFVAVFDNKQPNVKDKFLKKDKDGKVKVYLTEIWNELPNYVTMSNSNVIVELVESQDDGKVYKLIF